MSETRILAGEKLTLHTDPATGHKSLRSVAAWKEGDVLCSFGAASVLSSPTRYTLQIDEGRHILLEPEYLWFINHSCDPNIFFDTEAGEIVCIKPIAPADEICFFYPSTEWHMAEPFQCHCGAELCLGTIQGAGVLPVKVLERYRLTPYILRKWAQK